MTHAFFMRTAKTLIRLGECPVWSESSLGAHAILLVLSQGGSNATDKTIGETEAITIGQKSENKVPHHLTLADQCDCQKVFLPELVTVIFRKLSDRQV